MADQKVSFRIDGSGAVIAKNHTEEWQEARLDSSFSTHAILAKVPPGREIILCRLSEELPVRAPISSGRISSGGSNRGLGHGASGH